VAPSAMLALAAVLTKLRRVTFDVLSMRLSPLRERLSFWRTLDLDC